MCAWFMHTDGIVSFITQRIKWACAINGNYNFKTSANT